MRLLILLTLFLLNGCGSTSSARIDAPTTKATSFIFYDSRPGNQKIGVNGNESKGTKYYSDNMLNPPPATLIKSVLHTKLDKVLASKTVSLTSFAVSVQDESLYGTSKFHVEPEEIPLAIFFAPLIAIAAIESGIDGVNAPQVVQVEIAVEVDQKPYFSGSTDEYEGHVGDRHISLSINKALDILIANIEAGNLENKITY